MSQEANEQGPGAHRCLPEVSVSQVHLTIIAYYVGIQWTNKVFIIHSTILNGPEESRPTLTDAVNFHVIVTGIAPATAMPTPALGTYLGRSLHFMQLSTAPKAGDSTSCHRRNNIISTALHQSTLRAHIVAVLLTHPSSCYGEDRT